MSNDALLAETANHIASLENRRDQLLHEVHQIEEELLTAKARHGRLTNQNLPVTALPNEILSTIFLLCQGTKVMLTRKMALPFEIVVSHVSTHWRSVALCTPLLWRTIDLRITNQKRNQALQQLSAQLERSDQCLLDISLDLTINDKIPELLHYITPHAQRWFRVSIDFNHGTTEDISAPFQPLSAPNLTYLSLCMYNKEHVISGTPRTEYPDICHTILSQGAPSLIFVRIAGTIVGNISPPLTTTRIFHFHAWPKSLMSLAQFRSLFTALPCLVHLSLTGLSIQLPRDPLETTEPISLPALRSLQIVGDATPCYRLLSFLSLPNLESLLLHDVGTFHSAIIPSLHSLTLRSCHLSSADLEALFRSFPRVTTLDLDASTPEMYPMLEPDERPSTNIPWPELQTISLRGIFSRDVAPFVRVCLRRVDCGSPLRCVYLDRRTRKVVKDRDLLDGLREFQTVENLDEDEEWPADSGSAYLHDAWY